MGTAKQSTPTAPQIHRLSDRWAGVPRERWVDAFHKGKAGLHDKGLRKILPELYALLPQPGKASHPEMPVNVLLGGDISVHAHPEWLCVYYIDPGDPPCAIVVDGERILPAANTALILAPMTLHAVERSMSGRPRLSLALRWETQPEGDPRPGD